MEKLRIGLVGIGGIGRLHLKNIKHLEAEGKVTLDAVCESLLEKYRVNLSEYSFNTVREYNNYDNFLKEEKGKLDLVIIATPIPLHKDMCCNAMEAGYDVFLEKPPAVIIQDLDKMLEVKSKTGRFCGVNFQHTSQKSFKKFISGLKEGKIGEIISVVGVGTWKRTLGYFTRSPWVGKLLYKGEYVLDGTVNNPFAHLLNNSLIAAGSINGKSKPSWVKAELYRCNEIESEDNSCIRVMTEGGVEVLYYASICAENSREPYILVKGTEGSAYWDYENNIKWKNSVGIVEEHSNNESHDFIDHIENVVDYLQGITNILNCSLDDTENFVLASNLAFLSSNKTYKIEKKYLNFYNEKGAKIEKLQNSEDYIYLTDIENIIDNGVKQGKLYSELEIPWSVRTNIAFSKDLKEFNLFK